jgi:methyltransferase (TIGR00027 family)
VTRTENDTWDIATSVGATAVMVALARAAETGSADPLIRDQFAEPLVSTPELAEVREQVSSWWTVPDEDDAAADYTVDFQQMIDYQAVRTHFFDAFFAAASAAGIDQVVILAAGLDSRAYRLDWPGGTVVYELDLPKVLEYKVAILDAHGAKPATTRREVPVDLRRDWPKALRDNGFDRARPTAWLAEGLLPFLPGAAQEAMFAAIDRLSGPGSRIAIEVFGFDDERRQEVEEQWAKLRAAREKRGEDVSFDPMNLWYDNEGRPDTAEWFGAHGWTTQSVDGREESARLGRLTAATADDERPFFNSFVTAEKDA